MSQQPKSGLRIRSYRWKVDQVCAELTAQRDLLIDQLFLEGANLFYDDVQEKTICIWREGFDSTYHPSRA